MSAFAIGQEGSRLLHVLGSLYAEALTHARQEISRVRQDRVDVFPGEFQLRAVIRGLAIQEGIVQPS